MKRATVIITLMILICILTAVIILSNNNDESLESLRPFSTENNESQLEANNPYASTLSDEPSQCSDILNTGMTEQTAEADFSASPSAELSMLINEQDDKKGLIFLGLPYDELLKILDKNAIGHVKMEDFESYVIDFRWYDGDFLILLDEENNLVNGIEVSGPAPVKSTATQKGLNLGDTHEKMVEFYGDDYTEHTEQYDDEIYTLYDYEFGDHYFEVWFQSGKITSWKVLTD